MPKHRFTSFKKSSLTFALIAGLLSGAGARELHVRGTLRDGGEDGSPENPYRTITAAARAAAPGDTVLVHPVEGGYRETVDLYKLAGGEAGKPITIDGQGSELIGADPVDPAGWKFNEKDEIYTRDDIHPKLFLVVDGKLIFETYSCDVLEPGEFAYVEKLHQRLYHYPSPGGIPKIEALASSGKAILIRPDQWQVSERAQREIKRFPNIEAISSVKIDQQVLPLVQARSRLKPGQWCEEEGIVYFKPPADKPLSSFKIEACVRNNGVQITGTTAHFIIRNFNARYFYNDGYNIHGNAKALEFTNCNARDMGDEGFSAHDFTETLLDGAVYENCDNGIYNVNTGGKTITRNVVIRSPRSVGFGASPRESGVEHTLENAILIDCPTGLKIGAGTTVSDAVIIANDARAKTAISLEQGGNLKRVAVTGASGGSLRVLKEGTANFSQVSFNTNTSIHVRSAKPLGEIVRFDSCAVATDLKLEIGEKPPWKIAPAVDAIATTGKDNSEFPAVSTVEFLQQIRDGKLPGPSPSLIEKATRELKSSQ